jgi:hypothetical protein
VKREKDNFGLLLEMVAEILKREFISDQTKVVYANHDI